MEKRFYCVDDLDNARGETVAEKLFHPTMVKSTVEKLDPDALEFSAWILHDLGWLTQQGMLEEALSRIKWYAELNPEAFLKACSNGLTVILNGHREPKGAEEQFKTAVNEIISNASSS